MSLRIRCRALLLVTAIFAQITLAGVTLAQQVATPIVQMPQVIHAFQDPPKYGERCCCLWVKCEGSNSWTIIKACGPNCEEDVHQRAAAYCKYQGYIVDTEPVDTDLCIEVDETFPIESVHAELGKMALAAPVRWKVHGYLCYCDGTTGRDFPMSGATYCEVVQRLRKRLLEYKDPCKRAYLKFCVLQSPCEQNACNRR